MCPIRASRLTASALLLAGVVVAETTPVPGPARRPRIGLVLSGGGARGCAHAGVLEALEALRIPVDVIAATSMGAIVGGSYAAGYSPSEIIKVLTTSNWNVMLTDREARENLPFRRKEEDLRYLSHLEVGISGGKLTPPRGVVAGQNLNFLLSRYALRAVGIEDFDRLPIPFHAVAIDLVTGHKVVLSKGSLAEAMRASMSVPPVFAPVERGDQLLADGGLVDILPVDVAREMGADVVIAVNVGVPVGTREGLDSLVGITARVSNLLGEENLGRQLADADLVITPELADVSPGDFQRAAEIVERGRVAIEKLCEGLQRFALPEDEYARFIAHQRGQPLPPITIAFVNVEGASHVSSRVITNRIHSKAGSLLDLAMLEQDLIRIYDLGDFESVGFRIVRVDGAWGLVIVAKEKPWGPDYLRFAMSYDDDLQGDQAFSLLVNYTRTHLNSLGAEWRTDFQAGSDRRVFTELYLPLDTNGRWFVAPYGVLESIVSDVYENGIRISTFHHDSAYAGFHLGLNLGHWGELRGGLLSGSGQADPVVGVPGLPKLNVKMGGADVRFVVDRLDNVDLPNRGVYTDAQGYFSRSQLGAANQYDRVTASFRGYYSFGRQAYFVSLAAGTSLATYLPPYDEFTLGGLFSFSGFRPGELRGQYFGVFRLGAFAYTWKPNNALVSGVRCGAWVETGNVWETSSDVRLNNVHYTATGACGVATPVGPVYLGVGTEKGGQTVTYLSVGRRF